MISKALRRGRRSTRTPGPPGRDRSGAASGSASRMRRSLSGGTRVTTVPGVLEVPIAQGLARAAASARDEQAVGEGGARLTSVAPPPPPAPPLKPPD